MVGAAVAGALSMIFKSAIVAPHGGIFVLFIPNAVTNLGGYIICNSSWYNSNWNYGFSIKEGCCC